MQTQRFQKLNGVHRIYLVSGALIITAWGALIAWQRSSFAGLLGHETLADHYIPFASQLSAFLLSWLLMTIAMMLPASLPLLVQSQRHRTGGRWFTILVVAGYLSSWLFWGFLAFLGDNALHEMTGPGAPLAAASDFIAPAILLAAGLYQLAPLKQRFTERCKPSASIELAQYEQQDGGGLKLGLHLGFICIGSCWSLMLVLFAFGHHRLDWMVALSCITVAERHSAWGHYLAKWVGAGLVAWGAFSVITLI